jgi:hypothetical protein
MEIAANRIRSYRLHAHHLDRKIPMSEIFTAAGVCGLQNTPPGAWETSLFNRLDGCTLQALNDALYSKKTLLQAWGYRGVPVVFPAKQSDIFLTPLIAREGEQPWIYTLGIAGALDYLHMSFDDLLSRIKETIKYLDNHTIKSKEALDKTLADIIHEDLPEDKQVPWCAPSMYGNPEKQTVGGAAVSFLLRPCSFLSLVVFGDRQGNSPTFTSYKNWVGYTPVSIPDADKELMRKFLHCYGPATVDCFMNWLGCSPQQARRLWNTILDEIVPVQVGGKTCYMLSVDMDSLLSAESDEKKLILLGAHDPYLDMKDRTIILENKFFHKTVWRFVANPGAILKGGRIIGTWKAKTLKDKLDISITAWETVTSAEQPALKQLVEEYAAFRLLRIRNCTIESV